MKIAVTICTRRRPEQLGLALSAVSSAALQAGAEVFVVVVENDDADATRQVVEKVAGKVQFQYFLESQQGISSARNRAITEALALGADWIATCDDDGEMAPDCLSRYIEATQLFPKERLFIGRARRIYPASMPVWYPRSDSRPIPTGGRPKMHSTANSFFHRSIVADDALALRFDPAFGLSGGEDVDFFLRAARLAGPLVWVEEAVVAEKVIESRANLKHILKLQLRSGQNRARVLRKNESALVAQLKIFHAIYQGLVFGLAALPLGAAQLLVDKNAGLTRISSGLAGLSSTAGMIGSYFFRPMEWYKVTDGH